MNINKLSTDDLVFTYIGDGGSRSLYRVEDVQDDTAYLSAPLCNAYGINLSTADLGWTDVAKIWLVRDTGWGTNKANRDFMEREDRVQPEARRNPSLPLVVSGASRCQPEAPDSPKELNPASEEGLREISKQLGFNGQLNDSVFSEARLRFERSLSETMETVMVGRERVSFDDVMTEILDGMADLDDTDFRDFLVRFVPNLREYICDAIVDIEIEDITELYGELSSVVDVEHIEGCRGAGVDWVDEHFLVQRN